MKKLVLATLGLLSLVSCGGTPDPQSGAQPYSALGTWDIRGKPDGEAWRNLGSVTFTKQDASGGLDGVYRDESGVVVGTSAGNVNNGKVGLTFGANIVDMTGTFDGNSYKGRFTARTLLGSGVSQGDVEMTRR